LLLLPFAGCGEPAMTLTDAQINERLAGKWKQVITRGAAESHATHVFEKDGVYKCETINAHTKRLEMTITGRWQVTDGVLVYTIETCTPNVFEAGEQVKDTVRSLTASTFKYESEDGEESTMTRLSE
jgi:hypothetical protein